MDAAITVPESAQATPCSREHGVVSSLSALASGYIEACRGYGGCPWSHLLNIDYEFSTSGDADTVLYHKALDPVHSRIFRRFFSLFSGLIALIEITTQLSGPGGLMPRIHYLPMHAIRLRDVRVSLKQQVDTFRQRR